MASYERKDNSRAVLWIASHCWTDSKREEYVKQLNKFINVTVVGKCAKKVGGSSCAFEIENIPNDTILQMKWRPVHGFCRF